MPVDRFPAQWDRDGKSAGYKRNVVMAILSDALIALRDGKSRGTKHMIEEAKRRGLRVLYITLDNRFSISNNDGNEVTHRPLAANPILP